MSKPTTTKTTRGQFVISLDFELMWGMFDKVTEASYGENIRATHEVVPRLLNLFEKHDIHATWAFVGLLSFTDSVTVTASARQLAKPLRAERIIGLHSPDEADCANHPRHYFAPELLQAIAVPRKELASHTFSHYYVLEDQVGGEAVVRTASADYAAMHSIGNQLGTPLTSLVFPRNQWSETALTIASQHGITCFRGTEHNFLYRSRSDRSQNNRLIRALRLLDNYCNLTGHHTHAVNKDGSLTNVPASRFLRPYSRKLFFIEWLRLRRIKNAMTYAAKTNTCYHLWWHPHNFGAALDDNFGFLEKFLSTTAYLMSGMA